jgi:hypothetical protein
MDYNNNDIQDYIGLFVGKKYHTYYEKKWNNRHSRKLFLSFNISAFLFDYVWFLYRKMYVEGVVIYIIPAIIFNILLIFKIHYILLVFLFITLIFKLLIGFLGNYLFLRNVRVSILKLTKENNYNLFEYLKNRKCVNKIIIGIFIGASILGLVSFIFLWFIFKDTFLGQFIWYIVIEGFRFR